MKYLYILAILVGSLFVKVSAGQALENKVVLPHTEEFEHHWKLVSRDVSDNEVITEWLPNGESYDNFSQIFTVQAYKVEDDFELKDIQKLFILSISDSLEDSRFFNHKNHIDEEDHLFFEWWVSDPASDAGHEWVKLIRGEENEIFFIRYITNKSEVDDTDALWKDCIENAKLALIED